MKEILSALKRAREKCTDAVDKSTASELDEIILQLEEKLKRNEMPKRLNWLSMVIKALALINLLAGDDC